MKMLCLIAYVKSFGMTILISKMKNALDKKRKKTKN